MLGTKPPKMYVLAGNASTANYSATQRNTEPTIPHECVRDIHRCEKHIGDLEAKVVLEPHDVAVAAVEGTTWRCFIVRLNRFFGFFIHT